MALLTSELWRIRAELGYPTITIGAMPYIDIVSIFEQVILPYTQAGAITTSVTAVVAASPASLVTLTLGSSTGFAQQDRVWVDIDDAQEDAHVRSISGNTITLFLAKAHGATGGYPVTVDGGEAIVRDLLDKIRNVANKQESAATRAGLKKVDEIEFFGSTISGGSTVFDDLSAQREYWRKELASTLGVIYLRGMRRGQAHGRVEAY